MSGAIDFKIKTTAVSQATARRRSKEQSGVGTPLPGLRKYLLPVTTAQL